MTANEKLYLLRRSKRMTQPQFAHWMGITAARLMAMERGTIRCAAVAYRAKTTGDIVTILRRRAGLTIRQMAKKTKVSHVAVIRYEMGDWPADKYLVIVRKALHATGI